MDFRLLGAFEIEGQTGVLRRQERSLLAILLLRANEPVPPAELVDLLWPDSPPADPRGSVQVYLSRLRKALPGITITSSAAGYAVQVPPESIDVERFRLRTAAAREQQDPVLRSDGLRAALDLWRGDPLADLLPPATRARLAAGLDEERSTAIEERVEADLQAGRHEQLADELAELVSAGPQRERLTVAWMTALYRSGRRADALQAYADLAERLVEQFGLDPAPRLRRLHLAILRDDPALQLTAAQRPDGPVPRELPVDISLLVGRDELLADAVREVSAGQAAVYCLWGGAGVGKSAAGTRIGHLVAEAFPDGQLFARLQDVGGEALPASTLLGRMLRSLGMRSAEVPPTLAEREQVFRRRTEDLAVLVVLDDALDAATVTSLLPAGARCAAIVTSRKPLPELTRAVHHQVEPLDSPTSRSLLTRLIGRTLREQAVLNAVADECVGLPLALRIIGSRLALSGDDALQAVAGALADDGQRLDSMVAGDLAVRTSLGRTLTLADPEARHLLERLSLVGVTEFPSWVAAPLLDCDEPTGAAAFDRLVDLGLVELVHDQQYKMHALVRSYAAERLVAEGDSERPQQRYLSAVQRLAAVADAGINYDGMAPIGRSAPEGSPSLPAVERAIESDAASWFDESWPLVIAAAGSAVGIGALEQAAAIALPANGYLTMRDLREVRIAVLELIRDAAITAGKIALRVRVELAAVTAYEWNPSDRLTHSENLLTLAVEVGEPDLEVQALRLAGGSAMQTLDIDRAKEALNRAIEIIDRFGELERWRSVVLRILGHLYADTHDYVTAEKWAGQAVEAGRPGSIRQGEALLMLGEIQIQIPKYDAAEANLVRAAEIFARLVSGEYVATVAGLRGSLAARQGRVGDAEALLDVVRAQHAKAPLWAHEISIATVESDVAMARGEVERGRQLRRDLIERAQATGFPSIGEYFQHLIDTDDRDPANRR
ncbi:AfsR/SARP family transcriptional regulator [Kribbella sp. CA-293567]|uniref:AfsR/SARP family transcriptional regulator n=1 Tax=Kribbella sp. CA-293567 TaxID=3002436 RepID=UPI0022DD3CFA|nr:AfsR/SARP family transcriptional regulator [Kribbella sp. CA-293567]WBQ02747.1 BTAD domain-containing putative transcriptional regulator [Kribbella sp. CA-293567]